MNPPRSTSPLPLYDEALRRVLECVSALGRVEQVALLESGGRVLAADVHADRDYPPFNRSAMDGYALRSADIGRYESFEVVGMVAAGTEGNVALRPGQAARIATGAPLPPDADVVIRHEESDRAEPVRFAVREVKTWSSVHRRGEDARKGDAVLAAGTLLGAQHLGIFATVGCARVPVFVRPCVAILTSGDEVLPHDAPCVADHQIRNSNQPMLARTAQSMGAALGVVRHLPDRHGETIAALGEAIAAHDVVITVGGISAGERDCFHEALAACQVETILKGAAIQPGKPIFVGRAPREGSTAFVVGLPGNPVSALATAHLFLWPILRTLGGAGADLPWTLACLSKEVRANAHRQAFRPSKWDRATGSVEVLHWAGSGDLIHTTRAHGLCALPMADAPIPAGAMLRLLPWCWES